MQRRWVVRPGPELEESKASCELPAERLDDHEAAFRLALERDPFRYSEAFGTDSRRVLQTRDDFHGVMVTAYAVLYEDITAELKWIETHPLSEEDAG